MLEDCDNREAELRQRLQLSENCEVDLLVRLQRFEKRQHEIEQRLALEIEKRKSVEEQLGSRPPAKRRTLDEVLLVDFLVKSFLLFFVLSYYI